MSSDVFSPEKRSAVMRAVRGQDTRPERKVRALLSAAGYRYRLNVRALPGAPDLAFKTRKAAIFIHGCFWHGHDCKRGARAPKANNLYWRGKIAANRARDQTALGALGALGWRTLVVWECEMKDDAALLDRMIAFLR